MFNPGQEYAGQTVLLTGGLGFLGSIVLEQLLRLTDVEKVYLLVRSKRQFSAEQRVERMLCSPLFNMLHDDARKGIRNVFTKVQAVNGDLSLPGMGFSDDDAAAVLQQVTTVIHCAADIELDAAIQKTLKANYMGTRNLLQLASSMPQLSAFVHTSTYFVLNHVPRGSVAKEEIHRLPLSFSNGSSSSRISSSSGSESDFAENNSSSSSSDSSLGHTEYVAALLEMEPEQAEAEAAYLMQKLNFNSNYAFGKFLTELLFADSIIAAGVSRAVVRPSLIAPVAMDPYPGYVSGYGGPSGYTMGYAVGFFHNVASIAYGSDYVMDLIPADTVAAVVVAAGAAALESSGSTTAAAADLAIYHAASGHSYPCPLPYVLDVVGKFWEVNPPPLLLPLSTPYARFTCERLQPTQLGMTVGRWITQAKIYAVGWVLWAAGKTKEANLLKTAFKAFNVYNSRRYDRSFASAVDNVHALQSRMPESLRKAWPMVWEESVMHWERYGYIACSGMRRLLFRVDEDTKTHLTGIKFEAKQGAQPAELGLNAGNAAAATKAASGTAADALAAAAAADSGTAVGSAVDGDEAASAAELQEIELVDAVDAVMDVGGQASGAAAVKDQAESRLCAGAAAAAAGGVGGKVIEVTAAASVAVAQ